MNKELFRAKYSSIYISMTLEYYLTDYTGINVEAINRLFEEVEVKYDFI